MSRLAIDFLTANNSSRCLRVLLPDMALEIVVALKGASLFVPIYWIPIVSGGIMDIIYMASKVLGIFEGWSIVAREVVLARGRREVRPNRY